MVYIEASEVQARFSELVERVLAGEEVRFRQGGAEIAMRRTDDERMARMRQMETEGKLKMPLRLGEYWEPKPVPAADGGNVGAVEALIADRESGF